MKIFYFLTKSEVGGAQTVVFELLQAHHKRGDSVTVMASGNGWLAERVREFGFDYIENQWMRKTYNPVTIFRAGLFYRKMVSLFSPDIVSIHNSFSGVIGRFFRVRKIPVVYTAHGWGFVYGSPLMKYPGLFLEKIASRFCDAIICVSQSDLRIAQTYKVAPLSMLHVVHNGVDVERFVGNRADTPHVVFVGRFAHPKLQGLFVEACALLPQTLKETMTVSFVGSGPLEQDVRTKVKQSGLEHVSFSGECSREEGLRIVATAWITVLLSESEGFPMSLIESLQLGVPVVASDVGGVNEIVTNDVGILVGRGTSSREVASIFERLLSNKALVESLSVESKLRGRLFSGAEMSKKVFALYESLI